MKSKDDEPSSVLAPMVHFPLLRIFKASVTGQSHLPCKRRLAEVMKERKILRDFVSFF